MVLTVITECDQVMKPLLHQRLLQSRVVFPNRTAILCTCSLPSAPRTAVPTGMLEYSFQNSIEQSSSRSTAQIVQNKRVTVLAMLLTDEEVFDQPSDLDHTRTLWCLVPSFNELAIICCDEKHLWAILVTDGI